MARRPQSKLKLKKNQEFLANLKPITFDIWLFGGLQAVLDNTGVNSLRLGGLHLEILTRNIITTAKN